MIAATQRQGASVIRRASQARLRDPSQRRPTGRAGGAEAIVGASRARVRALLGADLPPLTACQRGLRCGAPQLVARLLQPRNYLLSGPTRTAKTFHLQHLALALEAGDVELPVFFEADKYRGGDFWQTLRQSSAPFSFEDPKQLLDVSAGRGLRPVLLLDALNECGEAHRPTC